MHQPFRTPYPKLFRCMPAAVLVLEAQRPFRIVEATNAYLQATLTERDAVIGRGIFEVFEDNPADPKATGVTNLGASLDRVVALGRTDSMPRQKPTARPWPPLVAR